MAEEDALITIVSLTDDLEQYCQLFQEDYYIPPEVVLSMLVRVTRIYADKCGVPLDRVMRALETAGD